MIIRWFKKAISEDLTVEEMEAGAAYLSAITGSPYFNEETPGPDMSEHVKRYGTVTRIFKNTRHDN